MSSAKRPFGRIGRCLIASLLTALPAAARSADSVLAICPASVTGARFSVALAQPDGQLLTLLDAAADRVGCSATSHAFDATGARWLGAIPREVAGEARRIVLTSRKDDERITSVEAERPAKSVVPGPLMPRSVLFPVGEASVFGADARARVEQTPSEVTVKCQPGNQPAGAIFALGRPSARAALAVELEASGDNGFHARLVGVGALDGPSEPLLSVDDRHRARLQVPPASAISLEISCPTQGGRLHVQRGIVTAAGTQDFDLPAAWVWNASQWRDESGKLLASAQALGLGTLFVSVEIDAAGVVDPVRLADFIARASAASIAIVVVEGDPAMTTATGRAAALERARSLAAYQANARPAARLSGVQYDIEPYLSGSFAADPAAAWMAWSNALTALASVMDQSVDAVVPYWIIASPGGQAALASALPALRRITVMAYRTEPTAIIAAAEPVLAWASSHGVPVSVALESGPIKDEWRTTFSPARAGEVHVVLLGAVAAVLVFDAPRPGAPGRTFGFSHSLRLDPDRVSFSGNAAAAARVATAIAPDLAAWPATRGVAFHGLAEIDAPAAASASREERLP